MNNDEFRMLAQFRAHLRQFDYYSEQQCAALGLASQQYRALLAIKGHPGPELITITELAQQIVIKHNSAVGMVDRLAEEGLVRRQPSKEDRRRVGVKLTPHGEKVLRRLAVAHRVELHRISVEFRRYFRYFSKPVDWA
ncbi:MAG: MarR family winged helix-turn-helix transcriptional regulator [Rhodoferax sp.]